MSSERTTEIDMDVDVPVRVPLGGTSSAANTQEFNPVLTVQPATVTISTGRKKPSASPVLNWADEMNERSEDDRVKDLRRMTQSVRKIKQKSTKTSAKKRLADESPRHIKPAKRLESDFTFKLPVPIPRTSPPPISKKAKKEKRTHPQKRRKN